jgi:four helix bundle protein
MWKQFPFTSMIQEETNGSSYDAARTKAFTLDVIRLVETFPRTWTAEIIGKQLLRSATSVSANYRAFGRAKSQADFIAKLCIVEEEADESHFWMELLVESGICAHARLAPLLKESDEITAIVVASIKQARAALRNPRS